MTKKLDDSKFWRKVRNLLRRLPFVRDAVAMYFCMKDPRTPAWVKAEIAVALVYFVSPMDLIPDFIVPTGYVDDAGVVSATLALVSAYVSDDHYRRTDELLS